MGNYLETPNEEKTTESHAVPGDGDVFLENDRVKCRFEGGGEWRNGVIKSHNDDGTYQISPVSDSGVEESSKTVSLADDSGVENIRFRVKYEDVFHRNSKHQLHSVIQCKMQGWRKEMEDETTLEFEITTKIKRPDGKEVNVNILPGCCLFGVFDGHGGVYISKFAANNLKDKLILEVLVDMFKKDPSLEAPLRQVGEELDRKARGDRPADDNPASPDPPIAAKFVDKAFRHLFMTIGAKVEAKFGGEGKWYPGAIEGVNPDGTFAILFDDGDKEPSAKYDDILLLDGATPALPEERKTPALIEKAQRVLAEITKGEEVLLASKFPPFDESSPSGATEGEDKFPSAEKLRGFLQKAFLELDVAIRDEHFKKDGTLKPEYLKETGAEAADPAPEEGGVAPPAAPSEGAATSSAEDPATDGLVVSGIHSLDLCGTTATVVLVSPTHFIVANTGDTRCVLATNGKVKAITNDHKPKLKKETARIEQAGGAVAHGRVQGLLAVSRCLGDQPLKMNPEKKLTEQMVSPEPDMFVHERAHGDEFMLIACDGVFDVLTNDDACFLVRQAIERTVPSKDVRKELKTIPESLLDECLRKQSRDNMSSVLTVFPAAWQPEERIHLSAQYITEWKTNEVSRWLDAVGYGELKEPFEAKNVTGETLLSLDDAELDKIVPSPDPPNPGRRKRLMDENVKPLRLGFLAWSIDDAVRWLNLHGLHDMAPVFEQHEINGKQLAMIDVTTLKGYYRKSRVEGGKLITSGKIAKLVKRLEDLRVRGQGGDWFSLNESPETPAAADAKPTDSAVEPPPAATDS